MVSQRNYLFTSYDTQGLSIDCTALTKRSLNDATQFNSGNEYKPYSLASTYSRHTSHMICKQKETNKQCAHASIQKSSYPSGVCLPPSNFGDAMGEKSTANVKKPSVGRSGLGSTTLQEVTTYTLGHKEGGAANQSSI